MKHPRLYRSDEVLRIRRGLLRHSYPRLQMLLLVTLTGAAGLLASFLLLHAGLTAMWQRYLAAFALAYLVFLGLLWLWLRTKAEDYNGDLPDLSSGSSSGSGGGDPVCGGGGQFGGGGASGSFDGSPDIPLDIPLGGGSPDFGGDLGGAVGDALGAVGDADELAIPLVAVIAALAVVAIAVGSSLFMVYSAPTLFAELLVDGVLSASLYRRLRGLDTPHWLETAIRRTAWPFLLSAALTSASGWAMARYAPGAHSLGDVVLHTHSAR